MNKKIPLAASAYRTDGRCDCARLDLLLLIGCVLGDLSLRLQMHNGYLFFFFFQAEDGIRAFHVTGGSDVCSSDLCRSGPPPPWPRSRARSGGTATSTG